MLVLTYKRGICVQCLCLCDDAFWNIYLRSFSQYAQDGSQYKFHQMPQKSQQSGSVNGATAALARTHTHTQSDCIKDNHKERMRLKRNDGWDRGEEGAVVWWPYRLRSCCGKCEAA